MVLGRVTEGVLLLTLCMCACGAVQVPSFRRVVIDENFPGGYQVAVADLDGDGKPDILALGETPAGQIAWYRNPSWKRYPISADATRENIDFAVHDIDGDGELEIAVASDFRLHESTYGGTISWLKRKKSLDEPWEVHRIDAEPTTHRVRWADVDGDGKKELIAVPIVGPGAKAPTFDQVPARLILYRIPPSNLLDPWPKEVIDEALHVTHGLTVCDFDGDGRDEILTASFEGVHLFDLEGSPENARWTKTRLCAGNQEGKRSRGSSEVSVGQLRGGRRFIATIDPWHGNEVVVHLPPTVGTSGTESSASLTATPSALWERHVLDNSLTQGHALCTADFNGDGSDEIIAGFRGKGGGISIYCSTDESGRRWQKSVLDKGGIAAQGFFVFHANVSDSPERGAALPDFVATGGATHNVHLYLNVTEAGPRRGVGGT